MKSIFAWAKQNWIGLLLAAVTIGIITTMVACSGLDWGQIITTRVPNEVQVAMNVPPRISLNEGEVVLKNYRAKIRGDYDQEVLGAKMRYDSRVAIGMLLATNLSNGWEIAGWFEAVTDTGLTTVQAAAAGAPGGPAGLALGGGLGLLMSFVTGLLFKGPGTAKEKEASFKKGHDEGKAAALAAVQAMFPKLQLPTELPEPTPGA